tara:strand:- start:3906 stop:4859 length:954 start_codon:yes stop_codon:yes gene_type:complete
MDPLTMGLISAGATAAQAIPGAYTQYKTDKAQKKRLEELKRLEEMNALGLTEEQFANYRNRLEQPVMQAQKRADAEMRRLATPTAQPARQLQQAMLAQQNREAIEAQIASTLLGIDLQKQAEQRQEMKDLRAAQDERLTQRIDALTAPALAGAEAYIMGQTLQTLYNQPPQQRVETVSQTTGATPDQIQETFPILQKESGPDGLFPQGFEASNRMQTIAQEYPTVTDSTTGITRPRTYTFGNNPIPPPPILPTSPGFRPTNILSEMGMGITGQTELARRGFTEQDMIRFQQFRANNPNMSDEEALNYYLTIMGMGGL